MAGIAVKYGWSDMAGITVRYSSQTAVMPLQSTSTSDTPS